MMLPNLPLRRGARALQTRTPAVVLALLAGLMYVLALPPVSARPLGWIALCPLLLALHKASSFRRALVIGGTAAGIVCWVGCFWISNLSHLTGLPNAFTGAFLVLGYSLIGEINITFFAVIYWRWKHFFNTRPAVFTASLFALIELVTPKIFPDALGHSLLDISDLPAASSLIGLHGLSFLVAWFATALLNLAVQAGVRRRRRVAEFIWCGVVILVLGGYGSWRQHVLSKLEPQTNLDIALMQPNIGDPVGLLMEGEVAVMMDSLMTLYEQLTRESLLQQTADYVIWPETAVPSASTDSIIDRIARLAHETNTPVLFGGYEFLPNANNAFDVYNALYWMHTDGRIHDRYYKNKLIPLGEHIPLLNRLPFLKYFLPNVGEFSRGDGPRTMQINDHTFAPVICYEVLFPRYVRQAIHQGGSVILNITNDYWFGRFAEPEQHLALARMRAYETERPIIRSTNTGISALIDHRGRVTHRTGLWQRQVLRGTIAVPQWYETPYVRYGDKITIFWIVVFGLLTVLIWQRAR